MTRRRHGTRIERRTRSSLGIAAAVLAAVATLWLAADSVSTQPRPAEPAREVPESEPWDAPRTADGQPDIQGMWIADEWGRPLEPPAPPPAPRAPARRADSPPTRGGGGPPTEEGWSDVKMTSDRTPIIVDPPDGMIPWLPWATGARDYVVAHQGNSGVVDPLFLDPVSKCLPYGVPRINSPNPYSGYQILQRPGMVVIAYEQGHQYRIIRLDGRPHVGSNIRLWNGNSRGRWEDNTLVVDVRNLNGKTWVFGRSPSQVSGPFTSPGLQVVERFIFTDIDTIHYEVTMTDPNLYSQSWTISTRAFVRAPEGYRMFEYACHEGNRTTDLITSGNEGGDATRD